MAGKNSSSASQNNGIGDHTSREVKKVFKTITNGNIFEILDDLEEEGVVILEDEIEEGSNQMQGRVHPARAETSKLQGRFATQKNLDAHKVFDILPHPTEEETNCSVYVMKPILNGDVADAVEAAVVQDQLVSNNARGAPPETFLSGTEETICSSYAELESEIIPDRIERTSLAQILELPQELGSGRSNAKNPKSLYGGNAAKISSTGVVKERFLWECQEGDEL